MRTHVSLPRSLMCRLVADAALLTHTPWNTVAVPRHVTGRAPLGLRKSTVLPFLTCVLLTYTVSQLLYHGMSEEELPQYDEKADMWSAGVLLYEALTGIQPFTAECQKEQVEKQQLLLSQLTPAGIPEFMTEHKLSMLAQQFLADLLKVGVVCCVGVSIFVERVVMSADEWRFL